MPKMSIDGKELEFRPGQTVLQLAHENGVNVPYFCYHPGLSIAGNCRMCLVEIEGQKKPDISCNMACREGLKVNTQTDSVKKLQSGVMEFLLLNHPLDCPVCDQAGECWLQEYYMDYARHPSALRDPKTEKPRKAQVLGPQVNFDAERCILCTRCIRFLDEVTHTSELTIVNRGGHAEIAPFPGQRVENLYSSNITDICPVGALTLRDFRFQQRVWFLKQTDSVCNMCSNGCNVIVDANAVDRQVHRVRPRTNADVNGFWMCDIGRAAYKPTNAPTRVKLPRLGGSETTWPEATARLVDAVKKIGGGAALAVVGSPYATNESLWALNRFAREALGTTNIAREATPPEPVKTPPKAQGGLDLLKADPTPNRSGLDAILPASSSTSFETIRAGIESRSIRGLFVLESDLVRLAKNPDDMRELLGKLELLVTITSQVDETAAIAHVTLPACSYLEMDGTFTNFAGRVQRIRPAFAPMFESRPAWAILDYLAQRIGGGKGFGWTAAEPVFLELAAKIAAFGGLDYARVGSLGAPLAGRPAQPGAGAGASA